MKRGKRGVRRGRRRVLVALGLLLVCGTVTAGFWTMQTALELDRLVRSRFEGKRFGVPSRVFSAPMMVYPGLDWKLVDLQGTLRRLGYRKAVRAKGLPEGQYVWESDRVRVHVRSFEHPSRPELSRDVVLRLDGNMIKEIRTLPSGREMGAFLLEP